MSLWLLVGVGYGILLGLGLLLGRYLSARFPRGGAGPAADPSNGSTGPSHAAEWLPLGSAFDRALMPAAFVDTPLSVDA